MSRFVGYKPTLFNPDVAHVSLGIGLVASVPTHLFAIGCRLDLKPEFGLVESSA